MCMESQQVLPDGSPVRHYDVHSLYGWAQTRPTYEWVIIALLQLGQPGTGEATLLLLSFPLLRVQSVSSVAQLCLTLCDPMDCSTLGFPVHHQLLESQTHVHCISDAIQASHPLSSPSPPVFNLFSIRVFTNESVFRIKSWVAFNYSSIAILTYWVGHEVWVFL